jgi:hypothetical protein
MGQVSRWPSVALWREFELARPHILGAVLDAAAHGLRMLPHVRLQRLPRMADFALWATACESACRPAGTLEAAYSNNRRAAIENIVDADPVAALVNLDLEITLGNQLLQPRILGLELLQSPDVSPKKPPKRLRHV